MNRFTMECPYWGYECKTSEILLLLMMEYNEMMIDCNTCGKEFRITKDTFTLCN